MCVCVVCARAVVLVHGFIWCFFIVCVRGDGVGKPMDQSEIVVAGAGLFLLEKTKTKSACRAVNRVYVRHITQISLDARG